MKFFQKMERKYGRYAINNLMYYIILLYVIGLVLYYAAPGFYGYGGFYNQYMSLDAAMLLKGQIWRIITFMIYPPSTNLIFVVFVLLLYYSLGQSLERVWGAFRFNVYIFMGIMGHVVASLVLLLVFHERMYLTTSFLNASVFFAYAAIFPNEMFYLYFVFAVKAKWLAIFEGVTFALMFFSGGVKTRIEIFLALANFLVFFLMTRSYSRINPKEIKRKKEFQTQMRPRTRTHHVCAVCGRTDEDSPGMEFRYCSKCEGSYEYCMDHLYTHQHVKKQDQDQDQN